MGVHFPAAFAGNFISVCQAHIRPAGEPESTSQDTPCGRMPVFGILLCETDFFRSFKGKVNYIDCDSIMRHRITDILKVIGKHIPDTAELVKSCFKNNMSINCNISFSFSVVTYVYI